MGAGEEGEIVRRERSESILQFIIYYLIISNQFKGFMSLEDLKLDRPAEPTSVTVQDLLKRVKLNETGQKESEKALKKLQEEHGKFLEVVADELAKHARTIADMFSNVRAVESAALGVRNCCCQYRHYLTFARLVSPCLCRHMSRRTMDDARYYVVAAFMLIFPNAFPESLLSEFDVTRMTAEWKAFLTNLGDYYRAHLHPDHSTIQMRSVFSRCDAAHLVYKKAEFDENTVLEYRYVPHLSLGHFSTSMAPHKDQQIINASDRHLFSQLKFFPSRPHLGPTTNLKTHLSLMMQFLSNPRRSWKQIAAS